MKRLINIILALLFFAAPVFAADVKLSELPAASSMATGDTIPFTSDPGGTPVSKNITRENFALEMHSLLPLLPIATAAGTVNAITADYTPNVSLVDKAMVAFVATGANTSTTPTFSPDGLTARTIVKFGGGALVAGDIPAALAVCIVQYNLANTRWELLNPAHGKYLTGGTNTFNLTNGTASLDVAAGAAVDINANLTVGNALTTPNLTAAGQIPYATAAGVLGALAATSMADKKLFGNAGGTAPEWAAGTNAGTFTRDLTGATADVAVTGVGFKPRTIIFLAAIDGTATLWSIGWADATGSDAGLNQNYVPAMIIGATPIYIRPGASDYQTATLKSYDADGFTLTWTKTGSPTGTLTVYYLAFR